jgi:hypothetical protein
MHGVCCKVEEISFSANVISYYRHSTTLRSRKSKKTMIYRRSREAQELPVWLQLDCFGIKDEENHEELERRQLGERHVRMRRI